MSDDDIDLEDIAQMLEKMQSDIDDIQGGVNILSTIEKEKSKEDVFNFCMATFGQSENRRLTWYYADGENTLDEIAELSGISVSNVRRHAAELNNKGLLKKEKRGRHVYYKKRDLTKRIDLEEKVEEFVDEL